MSLTNACRVIGERLAPPTHHMHVNVVDHLAAASADVDGEPVALFSDFPLSCEMFRGGKEFAHEGDVNVLHIVYSVQVLLGNNEDVNRGFRSNVFKDKDVVIFVNDIGGLGLVDDLTKQAGHG